MNPVLDEARRLIAIPSHEDPGPVLDYLAERLAFLPWERQPVHDGQYNLLYLPPSARLVVNTHVDTVPALTMPDAFTPRVRDGLLYGRGAVDTKGLLAALVVAAEQVYKEQGRLDVGLALTVDEENYTANGSRALAPLLRERNLTQIVVLEPTWGRICTRQYGSLEFELHVRVPVYHAGTADRAVHPVRLLMEFVNRVEQDTGLHVTIFRIEGGWTVYATPPSASLLAEIALPVDALWEETERRIVEGTRRPPFAGYITYRRVDVASPVDFNLPPAAQWLAEAYRQALGQEPEFAAMPTWTDAINFAQAGLSCAIFGFGDLAVAHSEREAISLEDLERNRRVLYTLLTILTQEPQPDPVSRNP